MSWNPFKKKDQHAEQPATSAAPAAQPDVDDATDPLVPAGGVEERVSLILEDGDLRLEHVEVWGSAGMSDKFMRLLVSSEERANAIRQLVMAVPDEITGFRNLLNHDGYTLAGAFDSVGSNLSSLHANTPDSLIWPRLSELLECIAGIADMLAKLEEQSGWCWQTPCLDGISSSTEQTSLPDGLAERQLRFTAWDMLTPGSGSAANFLTLFIPLFIAMHEIAAANSTAFIAAEMSSLLALLSELAADETLTHKALSERLAALYPRFTTTGITDNGQKRKHNEDAYLQFTIDQASGTGAEFTLAAVADGMGGHASGEVASSLALDLLRQQLSQALLAPRSKPVEPSRLPEQLTKIIPAIDRALEERAALEPALAGMGTTLVGLAVMSQATTLGTGGAVQHGKTQACVFHTGDSRAYLLSAAGIARLTHDHSLVADLVASGAILPDEAFDHPRKNVITRCLGGSSASAEPDVHTFTPGVAEVVMLCSDGLTDALRDSDIARIVAETAGDLAALALALKDAANTAGGPDNITVLLVGCKIPGTTQL